MSSLGGVVNNISKGLTEGLEPGRVVTLVDYNKWLADLGPRKVQELVKQAEQRSLEIDELGTLQLHLGGGLLAAWGKHCRRMGWKDEAFKETSKLRQDLLRRLTPVPEGQLTEAENPMEGVDG